MPALDLRPLSLGELLDRTFFVYRRNFLLLWGIAAIPYGVAVAVIVMFFLLARLAGTASPALSNWTSVSTTVVGAVGGGFFSIGVIFFAVFLISFGALVIAVSQLYVGDKVRISDVFRKAFGRFWSLLGVLVLGILSVAAGLIFVVIPGIYVACRLSVAFAVAVIDKIGPLASIRRSFALTKGFAWRAFMIVLLAAAITYAAVAVFQMPFFFLMLASVKNRAMMLFWGVLAEIGYLFSIVLVAPVSTIGFVLFYYDLRVRKEAFDLQMMMQAIGTEPATPAATGSAPPMLGPDAS